MSPLQAALNTVEPEGAAGNRQHALLLTLYAFAAEAMKLTALDNADKDDARVAADSRAYSRIMIEIEKKIGEAPTVLGRVSSASTVQHVPRLPSQNKAPATPTQ